MCTWTGAWSSIAEFESVPVTATIERDGEDSLDARPSAPVNPKCATACETSSIIISNLKRTAGREISTFISLAPTASVSATTFALQDGDVMQVAVEGYGRPLRNPVRIDKSKAVVINVIPLG